MGYSGVLLHISRTALVIGDAHGSHWIWFLSSRTRNMPMVSSKELYHRFILVLFTLMLLLNEASGEYPDCFSLGFWSFKTD